MFSFLHLHMYVVFIGLHVSCQHLRLEIWGWVLGFYTWVSLRSIVHWDKQSQTFFIFGFNHFSPITPLKITPFPNCPQFFNINQNLRNIVMSYKLNIYIFDWIEHRNMNNGRDRLYRVIVSDIACYQRSMKLIFGFYVKSTVCTTLKCQKPEIYEYGHL